MATLSPILRRFRVVALLEGISVVALFCVAMPMKYVLGDARIMPVVGWTHGLLFLLFLLTLLQAHLDAKWGWGRTVLWFLASLVPFGTFVMERKTLKA